MPDADAEPELPDALARRFRDHRAALLRWVRRRVPDPVEVEDLVQDTFLRITQRRDEAEVAHFEGYLFRVAQSVQTDRLRRRMVRQADAHVPLEPELLHAEDVDALRALLAREKLRGVAAALKQLPDRTRAIFVLRRIEGLRYGEIATRLQISVSAVEKHMARAIEHLTQSLETSG